MTKVNLEGTLLCFFLQKFKVILKFCRLIQESLSASSAQATSESLTDHTHDTFKYLPVVQDTSNGKLNLCFLKYRIYY